MMHRIHLESLGRGTTCTCFSRSEAYNEIGERSPIELSVGSDQNMS